ncbi:hypothetical protein [Streptomyces avidinii]
MLYEYVRVTTRPVAGRSRRRSRKPCFSNSRRAVAIRISPSGNRAASALTLTGAPSGSDWMCTATPIAVADNRPCWARWLATTV